MSVKKLFRRPLVTENYSTMMPSELIQNNELLLNETDIASSQEQSEDENASFDQTISQSNFSRY